MVVHENYKQRFYKTFYKPFIGNNYIANLNASKDLMNMLKKWYQKFLYIKIIFYLINIVSPEKTHFEFNFFNNPNLKISW